jgi:hypothetical protein
MEGSSMFKKQSARKRAIPTGKGEAPPSPAARPAEPRRVEPRGVPASSSPRGEDRTASREQVAIDAYHRWLSRGKPDGTDWEDWFEAERQLAATA